MSVRFLCVLLIAHAFLGCAGHPPEALEAPKAPDGVLLIVVDALRPDHLGAYGYQRPTSPHLDEWAEHAAVFERAFTTSPWTLPSFGSMLTGELPARHSAGSRVRESNWTVSSRLNDTLPTLPGVLSEAGFATGAIINNPWLPRGIGLERGFDTYDYQRPGEQEHRRAGEVVDRSLSWIAESSESPFFFMMHILDPHMTYDAPAPVRGRFTSGSSSGFELPVVEPRKIRKRVHTIADSERHFITAAYDEEIAYVDQEARAFIRGARRNGSLRSFGDRLDLRSRRRAFRSWRLRARAQHVSRAPADPASDLGTRRAARSLQRAGLLGRSSRSSNFLARPRAQGSFVFPLQRSLFPRVVAEIEQ